MKNNVASKRITLLTDSQSTELAVSKLYIKRIVNTFSTLVVNVTSVSLNESIEFSPLRSLYQLLSERSERENLYVILLTNIEITITVRKLAEYINIIARLLPLYKHPKYLIFLFNLSTRIELKNFFKNAWTGRVLDITVVELIQEIEYNKFYNSMITPSVITHQYNPYNDCYKNELFSAQTELFPDKLKNLHKYTLHMGLDLRRRIPIQSKSLTSRILRSAEHPEIGGISPPWIPLSIQSLSKVMNFSYKIKYGRSMKHLISDLHSSKIDFLTEPMFAINVKKHHGSVFLPFLQSNHLLVRQYPQYKTTYMKDSGITFAIFIIILVITRIMAQLAKLNKNTWTIYNIIQVVMGNSVTDIYQHISEKILYLCLIYVYITFSTNILDILTEINFNNEFLLDLNTLEEVEEAGTIPCLWNNESLKSTTLPSLQKLLNRSVGCNIAGCYRSLYKDVKKFNACETNNFGIVVADIFSNTSLGLVLTFVKEPVHLSATEMMFTGRLQYSQRFQMHMYRVLEVGLIDVWLSDENAYLTINLKNALKEYLQLKKIVNKASSNFYSNIMILMLIGSIISTSVLFCEILWNYLSKKCENYMYNLCF